MRVQTKAYILFFLTYWFYKIHLKWQFELKSYFKKNVHYLNFFFQNHYHPGCQLWCINPKWLKFLYVYLPFLFPFTSTELSGRSHPFEWSKTQKFWNQGNGYYFAFVYASSLQIVAFKMHQVISKSIICHLLINGFNYNICMLEDFIWIGEKCF